MWCEGARDVPSVCSFSRAASFIAQFVQGRSGSMLQTLTGIVCLCASVEGALLLAVCILHLEMQLTDSPLTSMACLMQVV